MSETELRKKAIKQIEGEVEDSEAEDDSDEDDSEASDMETNFNENAKGKKQSQKSKDQGISGLKFMKRGEQKVKEQMKEQAKMLIQQLKEE